MLTYVNYKQIYSLVISELSVMDQNLPQIKVIVVGDSGVGKSSILYRFVND